MDLGIVTLEPFTLAGIIGTGENLGDIDIDRRWQRFIAQAEDPAHQVHLAKGNELHCHFDD